MELLLKIENIFNRIAYCIHKKEKVEVMPFHLRNSDKPNKRNINMILTNLIQYFLSYL